MNRRFLTLAALLLVLPFLTATADTANAAPKNRVEICHNTGSGNLLRITVAEPSLDAHVDNHGDWPAGDEVCDGIDNDCNGETDEGDVCSNCPGFNASDLVGIDSCQWNGDRSRISFVNGSNAFGNYRVTSASVRTFCQYFDWQVQADQCVDHGSGRNGGTTIQTTQEETDSCDDLILNACGPR